MAISSDRFTSVDISRLPPPEILEPVEFDALRDVMLADFAAMAPDFNALTPPDPIYKFIEMMAYYVMLMRQRMDDAIRQSMLAYAFGANLDAIGLRYGLKRFVALDGAQEADDDFRLRIANWFEVGSVAGPVGAYVNGAIAASADVAYASATSPRPGEVLVTVQSVIAEGVSADGAASDELLDIVADFLSDDDRRPMTDLLTVQSADVQPFAINAAMRLFAGPDPAAILAAARAKLEAWLLQNCRLGRDIRADGIHAALTVEGVGEIDLIGWDDIVCDATQAGHCTAINLTLGGTL